MEFDGYRVPGTAATFPAHGGQHRGAKGDIKSASAGVDYTWYAVLVWCGRKPSPKFCATKEDLTSSPYFQSVQVSTGAVPQLRACAFAIVRSPPSPEHSRPAPGQRPGVSGCRSLFRGAESGRQKRARQGQEATAPEAGGRQAALHASGRGEEIPSLGVRRTPFVFVILP